MRNGVKLQAHKGVESEYPENTMPAFQAAVDQGYEMIELDLRITKDKKIVVIHNSTINSKARTSDGEIIEETIRVDELTFEEISQYDFGVWFSEEFKGTKIPLFEDVLKLVDKTGVMLKIDNKLKNFSEEDLDMFFDMVKKYDVKICISCWNSDIARKTVETLPDGEISFDGMTDEKELKYYSDLAGKDRFSVWIPVDFDMASWAPKEWFATPEQCEVIKKYAKLCIWAIRDQESFDLNVPVYKPYALETSGLIKND